MRVMSKVFEKLSANIHQHAKIWIAMILALTVVFAFGLPNLEMKMGNDVFVDPKAKIAKDSNKYMHYFGGDSYYVLQSGKQDSIISHKNMQKVAEFDKKVAKVENVRGTTDIVTILNEELENAAKSEAASSLSNQFDLQDNKLQKDLMNELSDKQKEELQDKIQTSLTVKQQQQVQEQAAHLLTDKQQAQLVEKIQASLTDKQRQQVQNFTLNKVLNTQQKQQLAQAQQAGSLDQAQQQQLLQQALSKEQQAQIQEYTQSILNSQQQKLLQSSLSKKQQTSLQKYSLNLLDEKQQQTLVKTVIPMLPKVEKMSDDLLKDIFLSDNGKVPDVLAQLLPKNGKMNLILVRTSEKASTMDTDVQLNEDIGQVIKDTHFTENIHVRLGGQPGIIGSIKTEVLKNMSLMFAIAIGIMIVILALIFPVRRRLFPLLFVVASLIWTFGLMGWFHLPITLATMATLPIIIGLGTDFGVQFQNRYEEEFRKNPDGVKAARTAIEKMGPAVGVALIVMTCSFLTLFLSKAPMMQQFGVTLAIGVISSYLVEFALMFASLSLLDSKASAKTKNEKVDQSSKLAKLLARYADFVTHHAVVIMVAGIILAAFGFSVEKNIAVETDITKFIPQNLTALRNTNYLQDNIGSTTYLTYLVDAQNQDIRNKERLQKIDEVAKKVNDKYDEITAVQTITTAYKQTGGKLTENQTKINRQIDLIPASMSASLLSRDHHYATLQFKVKKGLSSADQLKLMNKINKTLKGKQNGMKISAAGAQSMMLVAIDNISANHTLIEIVGLAVIFLILFLLYRNWRIALYPVVPILIVLGLSPLTLWAMGTSYNPLTITLSALVLGIGTEFTILILERYREEYEKNQDTRKSIIAAVASVGSAITVSGLTVVGGFTAIMFSSFPILKQFGLITVLDTAYALISALTILPAFIYLLRGRNK